MNSGIEGAADRIGDATRFVKQAHTMLRRLLEAEDEGGLLAARIAPGVRLTLERLAHLETCVIFLQDALRDQLPGPVMTAAEIADVGRGFREAQREAFAEFDRQHQSPNIDTDLREGAAAALACRSIREVIDRISRDAGRSGIDPVLSWEDLGQIDKAVERGCGQ